ncbi:MAG: DUF6178 family protein [Polyangia bacterium]
MAAREGSPSDEQVPNNVVALSHYRARLGRGRQLRRADALLEAPDLNAAVRALPGDELYYVLHEIGLEEGAEILAAATPEQLTVALDFAVWRRDRIDGRTLGEWLAAIAVAPYERIGDWLEGLDSELVGLIIRRGAHVYDLTQEEPPDETIGTPFTTPDGFFLLDVGAGSGGPGLTASADDPEGEPDAADSDGGDDRVRAFIRLIDAFYRSDKDAARRMLVGARSDMDSELEETAYRWRQARMADLGFADYYEALEVYRELDPATVRIEDAPQTRPARPVDAAALRVPTALAERLGDAEGSPFARAAQKLAGREDVDDLRFALVTLTNRVMAADRVQPGNDEAVAAVLDRLLATLDLAIERLARDDDERGAAALRSIPLVRLFRLGVSLTGKVKRLAETLRRKGPFGGRGLRLSEPDDATVLEAVTRLRPLYPRLLDDPQAAGDRPFRSLADLARAAAALERAAAVQAIISGLGVTLEDVAPGGAILAQTQTDEAGLDFGVIARTVLVARLLESSDTVPPKSGRAPFRALKPGEVTAFEARLVRGKDGRVELPAALERGALALLQGAAPAALEAAAKAVSARWVATLAPLEPVLVLGPSRARSRSR